MGFDSPASRAACVAGLALIAGFVPVYMAFWCREVTALGNGSLGQGHIVAIACAASYLAFCLVTGARLSLGLHASSFTVAYAGISTALATLSIVRRRAQQPTQTHGDPADLAIRQLPLNMVIPSVAFVFLSVCIISLLNPIVAASDYPPSHALLYWVDAALMAVIIAVYLVNRGTSRRAGVIAFTLLSAYLVGMILLTAFSAQLSFRTANFPIIAGKNSFDLFVLMVTLTTAHNKHASPTALVALFLATVIELANLLSALVLLLAGSLDGDLSGNGVVLALMLGGAFAVTAVADVILALFLTRRERTAQRITRQREQARSQGTEPASAQWMGIVDNGAIFEQAKTTWQLTGRELDVLRAVCANASTQKIARELAISEATVYSHLKRIYQKTGVHSRQELIDLIETLSK